MQPMTNNPNASSPDREEGIFDSALQLPPGQRAGFVEKACGDDAQLRRRVEIRILSGALAPMDGPGQERRIHPRRIRLIVLAAASLGTAAAVAVSGLIGFVGLVVPHVVRRLVGGSYRIVLPVSLLGGGAFLVLADVAARTVVAPGELPIGVVTAFVGAPFFAALLRWNGGGQT